MATGSHPNEAYSDLEVVAHNPNDKFTYTGETYSNLESASSPNPPPKYPEKQSLVTSHGYDDGLQSAIVSERDKKEPVSKSRNKKKWLIGGIVAGVVVVAAVVGGACGALLSKKSSNTSSSNTSSNGSNSTAPNTVPSSNSSSNSSVSMVGDATVYPYYDAPTMVSWGYPHMEVIITNDTQNPLWLSRYPNATDVNNWRVNRPDANDGPFVFLTGQSQRVTHSIQAIARGGNNTDVFAIGSGERGLWSRFHNSTLNWNVGGWYAVDSGAPTRKVLYSGLSVASWSQTRIDAFALGQNGQMWQYFYDGNSGGWINQWIGFGGNLSNIAPTVVSWGQNRYDVFAVNQNGTLAYKYYDGAWSPSQLSGNFYDLGGQLTSKPAVVSPGVGQMNVFARGGDAGLWHISFNGRWSSWSRMGPSNMFTKANPSAVVLGDIMHVFAWSDSNGLLYGSFNWKTGSAKDAQFDTIATDLTGAPKAISDGVNVEVFAHVGSTGLGWKVLSGGKQWSTTGQSMTKIWQY